MDDMGAYSSTNQVPQGPQDSGVGNSPLYNPQRDEAYYKEIFRETPFPLSSVIQAISEYLDTGEHSYIFKGQMAGSKRTVTVKVDYRPLEIDANYNAIRDKVNRLKKLHHPGIAELIDFIPDWSYVNPETGKMGRSFIIMQYIPGKSLNQFLVDEGPVRQKRVLNWTIQLLGVLRYLHQYGQIAGRITPSNLVLEPRDRICMVDFEYISAVSDEVRKQNAQSHFIHPSTLEEFQAGILSDISYLGATMFELLTGKTWNPDNADANNALFEDAKVSPSVRDVIRKALAENPADRYQSAPEMEAALRNLPLQDPRAVRYIRQGVAASLLCAFMLALGGFYYVTGQSQLYRISYMERNAVEASAAMQSGDYTDALRLALEATERTSLDPPVTANAQAVLADALGAYNGVSGYQPFRSDFKLRGRPLKALFSPDGRTFAVLVAEASAYVPARCLQIFDAESGKEIAPFLSVRNADDCAFLFTDYDILLYEGKDGLTSYDLTTGKTVVWMKDAPSPDAQTGLALSADGKVTAYVVWEKLTAYIFNAQTQTLTRTLSLAKTPDAQQTSLSPMEHMAALDAAGRFLAVSLPVGGIGLFPMDGSEPSILSQTSQYRHFEGGFFGHCFFYTASNARTQGDLETFAQTECRLIDLDTMKLILELQEPTLIHAQADENGIYFSIGNDLYRVNPDKETWDFLVDVDNQIQSLRHAAGRLLITTAVRQTFVCRDDGAGRAEIAKDANFSIAELSKNYALLGSPDRTTLSLLKWRESGGDILTYPADYPHFGAYVHSDKRFAMLFNDQGFRIYNVTGEAYQETEFDRPSEIQSFAYLRGRTADGSPEEECLKVVYRDAVRFYSAKTGEILSEHSTDEPYDAPNVLITGQYRLEQATGDAIVIYSSKWAKRITEGILMDATELDSHLILFLRDSAGYNRYALALDGALDVTARIPQACDATPDGTLIFDDNQGHLSSGCLYSVEDLRTLAEYRLNGE